MHDQKVKRLQDWIALPSIAAENRNYPQGPDYMAQLAKRDSHAGNCYRVPADDSDVQHIDYPQEPALAHCDSHQCEFADEGGTPRCHEEHLFCVKSARFCLGGAQAERLGNVFAK